MEQIAPILLVGPRRFAFRPGFYTLQADRDTAIIHGGFFHFADRTTLHNALTIDAWGSRVNEWIW